MRRPYTTQFVACSKRFASNWSAPGSIRRTSREQLHRVVPYHSLKKQGRFLMTCLTDVDILLLALEDRALNSRQAQHGRVCETCRPRVASLRRALCEIAALPDDSMPSNDPCLDEAELALLVDGAEDSHATPARIAHLAGCAHCRREL